MQLQNRNLEKGLTGADVSLLHFGLNLIGYPPPEDEVLNNIFGPGTQQAVQAFQSKHGLKATGIVDAETAKAINTTVAQQVPIDVVLARLGEEIARYQAQIDQLRQGDPKLAQEVERLRTALQAMQTECERVKADAAASASQVAALEQALAAAKARIAELEALLKQPNGGQPDGFVVHGHVRNPEGKGVAGLIVRAYDQDLPSLQRDTPLGEFLGETTADADGAYRIPYAAEKFSRAEKANADLIVRTFADLQTVLVESPLWFNAPAEAQVDLVTAGDNAGLSEYERYLAAIAPLIENVAVADLSAADLDFLTGETGLERPFLAFLVLAQRYAAIKGKTVEPPIFYGLLREGLPSELADLLTQSSTQQREALKRALAEKIIPAYLAELLEQAVTQLKALRVDFALQPPGQEQPSALATILGTALPALEQQRTFLTLYTDHQGEIEAFWQKLRNEPAFSQAGVVDQIQFSMQLALLTGGNAPLVQALHQDKKFTSTRALVDVDAATWRQQIATIAGDTGAHIPPYIAGETTEAKITNYATSIVETLKAAFPMAYVVKGVAETPAINAPLVKQVLDLNPGLDLAAPLPATLNWGNLAAEEQKIARAALVALQAEQRMFPDLDVKAAVQGKEFANPQRDGVHTLLTNVPDFDLGAVHIDTYLDEQGAKAFAGIDQQLHEPITNQLKTMQRIYQVVPRYETMSVLLHAGLDSAQAVAALSNMEFVRQFAPQLGGAFQAQLVYESAQRAHDYALAALGMASDANSNVLPWAIGQVAAKQEMASAPAADQASSTDGAMAPVARAPARTKGQEVRATYEGLFGRFSLCECEHCRSVYSPAAYLVDLLHFLERVPESLRPNGRTPYTMLTARRPDLAYLPLTCENTNTLIPYIDLVNEVLESYIAYRTTLDTSIVSDTRPVSSAELLASPQHVNDTAYGELKGANYPLTLPFDRDLELVRTYLTHLGSSRYQVMKRCQPTRPLTADAQTQLAAEYLQIGPDELNLLTLARDPLNPTATSPVRVYYGYAFDGINRAMPDELATVATFLERTELRYADLVELLKTRFINPNALNAPTAVIIVSDDERCDTATRKLRYNDGSPLVEGTWDQLLRFIRLWRRLGWSIHDVDRALTALGVTKVTHFDHNFVQRLGQTVAIQDDLGLSLAETLSFWANIDTHGDDVETRQVNSLYARLFLNRTVRSLAVTPERFALSSDGRGLAVEFSGANESLSGNLQPILAALRLTATDLAAIQAYAHLADQLTLGNLSVLYRYAVLARSLRMPVRDLLTLCELSGNNPFTIPTAGTDDPPRTQQEQTARFIALARKVQQAGFSIAQLDYLLRHRADPARNIGLRPAEIVAHLITLRTGLRKLVGSGTRDEQTRTLLAALIDPADIDDTLALLNGLAIYTTKLMEQPTVTIPSVLREKFSYDAAHHLLRFTGAMTVGEQRSLNGLAGATSAYQAAVNDLFTQPRAFIRTKLAHFLDPEHAISELIDSSDSDPAIASKNRHQYIATQALSAEIVQILANALGIEATLIKLLLTKALHAYAIPTQPALTDFLALSAPDLSTPTDQSITLTDFSIEVRASFLRLHKAALLVTTFKLSIDELTYLLVHAVDFAPLDFNLLPGNEASVGATDLALQGWARLADYVALRDRLANGDELLKVFAAASLGEAKVALLAATGWEEAALTSALDPAAYNVTAGNFRDFFKNEVRLSDLTGCMELSRRLGVAPARLFGWRSAPTPQQAQEVQSAVKAKYEEQQWLAVAKEVNNGLRERQRDALIAFILARLRNEGSPMRTADELFEYFLIDVKMNACMATSRIKQAISSVQLFIQRCFLNIEPGVVPNALRADQWAWMRNYRVWEANRKVFLYPENWIEPELRDDKSPFFKELENELLQNDVTDETTEQAFLTYLEKLDEVARLDIRGMYWEHESELNELSWDDDFWNPPAENEVEPTPDEAPPAQRADILHVFGRTQGTPPIYYYRRLINHTTWTPWEKVQADIEGDHLIPVVYNRRLTLFWPVFRETTNPDQAPPQQGQPARQPEKRLEIKLAFSEYKNGKWSAKTMTKEKIDAEYAPAVWQSDFFFKVRNVDGNLMIDCIRQAMLWRFTSYVDTRSLITLAQPEAKPLPRLYEAILEAIEKRLRESYDSIESLLNLNLKILDGLRDYAIRPEITFDTWLSAVRFFMQPYTGLFSGLFNLTSSLEYISVGSFTITGCDRQTSATSINEIITDQRQWPIMPNAASINGQMFQINAPYFYVQDPNRSEQPVLGNGDPDSGSLRIPTPSYMLYPHQYYPYLLQAPFFYQDRTRAYFVTPEQIANVVQQVASPNHVVFQVALVESPFTTSHGDLFSSKQQNQLLSALPRIANAAGIPIQQKVDGIVTLRAAAPQPASGNPTNQRLDTSWQESVACPAQPVLPYQYPPPPTPTSLKLRFHTFFHPHVCAFVRALKRQGIPGLLTLQNQLLTNDPSNNETLFRKDHPPYYPQSFVDQLYPREDVDFAGGAYALYNWELFFHIPLLIAMRLNQNQRFAEARKWFHYIFDPTTSSSDSYPRRFWQTLPFYRNDRAPQEQIDMLLYLLSYRGSDRTILQQKADLEEQIEAWRNDPFNPHHIARMRITAYQKTVVMKYIDNLIAWGDQLFRQDTIESINEATQLYVLAYLMLGKRPEVIPPRDKTPIQNYGQLRPNLDRFSNALVATENALAGRRCLPLAPRVGKGSTSRAAFGTLYFCIPPNDKLLGYWDLVEDRLFKIRHCMNIEGVVRQLPLFEPPIDPGLLVRARAAGLDLSSVLNDIRTGLPHYRFSYLLQKALELCAEVRSMGGALLAALEKKDAEELALLRSTHELRLLEQVRIVRQKQTEEAKEASDGLYKSKEVITLRRDFYRDIERISVGEWSHMELLGQANFFNQLAQFTAVGAAAAHLIPNFDVGISGWAASPVTKAAFGGAQVGSAIDAAAGLARMIATQLSHEASRASINASQDRRWEDWKHQERLANKELEQIDKQIAAAYIRQSIAEQELRNHELQIEQTKTIDEYMRSRKFTRKELYDWMVAQISALYFQAYKLAYDSAKQAERAYQFERGLTSSNYVRFGQWDSLHRGLLAGEQLTLDLKRLESAYLDQNRRDYEITKHISLVLHDPLALIALKTTGACTVRLPEVLFDADYPGHYMRRIKSVSLTIPAVVGPYTSINCTVTLLGHKIRKNTSRADSAARYAEQDDDDRFLYNFAPIQSIATSHGQNDTGMFELNFRDERYLPFEGAGAISEWRIEMPTDTNAFDFDTIADVIIRLNYTARDGGDQLRNAARSALGLQAAVVPGPVEPLALRRMFSLKHEYTTEWFQFIQTTGAQEMHFNLALERFPFQFRSRTITVQHFDVFLVPKDGATGLPSGITMTKPDHTLVQFHAPDGSNTPNWPLAPLYNLPHSRIVVAAPRSVGTNATWTLGLPEGVRISTEKIEDIIVVCMFTV